jgi:hypothetical protein
LIKSNKEESQNLYKILADKLHQELSKMYEGTWHVIAGSDFGAEVGMQADSALLFTLENISFLVWRFC